MTTSTTYLPPVEHPRGLLRKLAYLVSRRVLGKVAGPLAVFGARMPLSFFSFYGKVSRLDRKLVLPRGTALLVRSRVANLNVCEFCMDTNQWFVTRKIGGETAAKAKALADYRTDPRFSPAERAALDYATELTVDKSVSPATIDAVRRQFSEREVCELAWLVASEHLYNLTNVGLNIGSDGMCELRPQ
ncbi:carboxymuconolactone decarboxylase family protein [Nocardia stercoris]|uniref:Carboxymuconolactone decarboxylase family protein n=1 Tax=Nocardia stercoris TaxID=2483361 RepID=A0A3M2L8N3_9NOCA|nr:carboxymuconolactone decarboxylase family protein [Nocardia stercoris]RMI32883.1 carboxymuconolactone decarboxylase family protein [Nocardia stercoris]